jgi:hypothetical protein
MWALYKPNLTVVHRLRPALGSTHHPRLLPVSRLLVLLTTAPPQVPSWPRYLSKPLGTTSGMGQLPRVPRILTWDRKGNCAVPEAGSSPLRTRRGWGLRGSVDNIQTMRPGADEPRLYG